MHYARQRRTGDASTVRKPGPKPSVGRRFNRELMGEWSDRTFARYWEAFQLLYDIAGEDGLRQELASATRTNGSINVSRRQRAADRHVCLYIDQTRETKV
jgi:hypothetical protein